MTTIDPTAHVAAGAQIGQDVSIGPFCIVGPNVVIGDGVRLVAHVHLAGHTTVGARTVISPFASLGGAPQSAKFRGGPTKLVIGADCDIREGVTMNLGTEDGGGLTEVGHHSFFMAYSHVGHDCRVGNHTTFANSATLGGHCEIGDHVFIGGLSAIHQFSRVGAQAMIGGLTGVRGDVIPFGLVFGSSAFLCGLNVVGMKRRGFSHDAIKNVRRAYQQIFFGDGVFADRIEPVAREFADNAAVMDIVTFLRASAHRSLCHPAQNRER